MRQLNGVLKRLDALNDLQLEMLRVYLDGLIKSRQNDEVKNETLEN